MFRLIPVDFALSSGVHDVVIPLRDVTIKQISVFNNWTLDQKHTVIAFIEDYDPNMTFARTQYRCLIWLKDIVVIRGVCQCL